MGMAIAIKSVLIDVHFRCVLVPLLSQGVRGEADENEDGVCPEFNQPVSFM